MRDVVGDGNDTGNPFDYDWFHEIIAGCIFISVYTISGEPPWCITIRLIDFWVF